MCFAILGLKVPGIKLKNPSCVKKTFPNFFQKLAAPPPARAGRDDSRRAKPARAGAGRACLRNERERNSRRMMPPTKTKPPIVIAIDGTSASGKSTNCEAGRQGAGLRACGYGRHVPHPGVVLPASTGRRAGHQGGGSRLPALEDRARSASMARCYLVVDGYYPAKEIRTAEVSAAVPHVAAVPKVREWMKKTQRDCIRFGSLVMEGRDIGTNVFPETDFKYYLDAQLEERSRRRAADGIQENLAARDQRDSQRAAAPLMIALGAKVINNSQMTAEQTSGVIIADIRKRLEDRGRSRRQEAEGRGQR